MTRVNSVYLAYPIDQVGTTPGLSRLWRQIDMFKSVMTSIVSWVFDPGDAFRVNPDMGIDEGLARINRAALNNADCVVAFLPAGVPSIGVPMEIDRARAQGKVVFVFSDADSYMLAMPGIALGKTWDDAALIEAGTWIMTQEVDHYEAPVWQMPVQADRPELMPRRGYADDAGLDLITSDDMTIPPGGFGDVPCGVKVQLPEHSWGMIVGRSSTFRDRKLLVHPGIIDTGYRGPLFAGVTNLREVPNLVEAGTRIAQLLIMSNLTMRTELVPVEALAPSERGERGFGSSGA